MAKSSHRFRPGGEVTRPGVATPVDRRSVEIDVDESYSDRMHPIRRAEATFDAYPDWMIPAHVTAIIPTADKGMATVTVRLVIDRRDLRILPGRGVHVTLLGYDTKVGAREGNA